MRPDVRIVLIVALLMAWSSTVVAQGWDRYLDGYHGPYRGRVLDAETKQPIAGASVVGVWSREKIYPLHSSTVFYAAREVLTEADGTFVLHAKELEEGAPQRTLKPYLHVFYPGYGSYRSRVFTQRGFQEGNIFEGGVTIGLPPLKSREERREALPSPLDIGVTTLDEKNRVIWLESREHIQHFLRLINVERAALGLEPIRY